MLDFWNSVVDLRRIEFVVLLVGILTPVLCGTLLLTLRQRVRTLIDQSENSAGFSHDESTRKLEAQKHRLEAELINVRRELSALQQATAPRHLTESDEGALVAQLRGVQAVPVLVSAYNVEEESYAYASQIAGAIRQAGWEVTLNKASMNDFKGVTVATVNLMQKPLAGLRELTSALRAAHVDVHQRQIAPDTIAGELQDGTLLVVVGRK